MQQFKLKQGDFNLYTSMIETKKTKQKKPKVSLKLKTGNQKHHVIVMGDIPLKVEQKEPGRSPCQTSPARVAL